MEDYIKIEKIGEGLYSLDLQTELYSSNSFMSINLFFLRQKDSQLFTTVYNWCCYTVKYYLSFLLCSYVAEQNNWLITSFVHKIIKTLFCLIGCCSDFVF